MRPVRYAVFALIGLFALSVPAIAEDDAGKPGRCFFMHQFENWKAPDNKTIYIRVNMNSYYRLDLAGTCPMLTQPTVHLITKTRGSNTVCTGIDWDLAVSNGTGSERGIPSPCIVKMQTPLSAAEVAAIPKKFKP